jgi:uncharacterized protein with PQ loop repeat
MSRHINSALVYLAGALIAASALPQIYDLLIYPEHVAAQSAARTAMLLSGNTLLAAYSYRIGALPICVISVIAGMLNVIVLGTIISGRHALFV